MIDEGHKTTLDRAQKEIPASWYRALTLNERWALWCADGKKKVAPDRLHADLAARKLSWWKDLPPFNQGNHFSERLAIDELTEEDLFYLLAEPIEAMRQRVSGDLIWLDKLMQSFTLEEKDMPCPLPDLHDDEGIDLLLRVIRPLLRNAWKRVHVEVQILLQRQKQPPFDPQTIMRLLFMRLPGQLLVKVSKVLALELNIMRVEGRLQGETPEERFAFFVEWCRQPQEMLAILAKYPVLARQLIAQIDQWRETSLEFLQRLCADWKEIRALFSPADDPGVLTEVLSGAGDAHRGGRSVFLLRFTSGMRLVYKPRSLAVDAHFQELLHWLNVRSKLPAFRLLHLLDKGTYGWVEFIEARDCTSPEQVERFYVRQGAYLALLYTVSATDVHAENLVAAGEQPMLIDVEALFRPRISQSPQKEALSTGIDEVLQSSVLSVGLLPYRFWSNEQRGGMDMSGLSEIGGQVVPVPVATWSNVGTDQMHIIRDYMTLAGSHNRPHLDGQAVDLCTYQHYIIFGFVTMYQLLLACRQELLVNVLPRFARDEIRVILRPTMAYSLLLQESFHPDVLHDALDLYRYLDRLWVITVDQPHMASVIAAERADLLSGDIPFFLTQVSSLDLYTSRAERITAFCSLTGMDMVTQRLQRLDEHDLLRQVWIIQASLASIAEQEVHFQPSTLQLRPPETPGTPERLRLAAQSIGYRLANLAIHDDAGTNWLSLSIGPYQAWQIGGSGLDFYNGLSGIAFFLAYLGAGEGQEEYAELAHSMALNLHQQLDGSLAGPGEYIGAFAGWGSLLYVFSHLYMLWHESWLLDALEDVIERIEPLIELDQQLDIMHGAAGCLLALLSVYTVTPTPRILANAIRCGDHILHKLGLDAHIVSSEQMRQKGLLTGFAHGAAGIALSLVKLSAVCQQERFRTASLALLSFERQLFSPAKKNWPDLRAVPLTIDFKQLADAADTGFVVAWCHGATGLGLSRMELLKHGEYELLRQEVDVALQTTLKEGFGSNHSLCHGDLGNLELLLTATQQLGMVQYLEPLAQLTAMLLECGERTGWVTGLPLGVETPGMMLGLAGIGYELLRLAQPQLVPNILLLASPIIRTVAG
ncbi:lanthionine synthetase [Dictyobacter alpinus]|uniref:Lanthionine synthetase n=1 Tax=Dictyobacter alpinus TaxID=2014873 RepID=A0A402BH47_9CHLR|nr:type 2 lanthipeptide synthetase LanM family protein [Dictyobacter alpinus]GCE30666.1 lanthionine synthetase [Dictyobacter alpinus]